MTKTKGKPNEQDKLIGLRIREIRTARKLSQEKLGAMINVTFQQIQKVERGTNRISAGNLQILSEKLGVPIYTFFPKQCWFMHPYKPSAKHKKSK